MKNLERSEVNSRDWEKMAEDHDGWRRFDERVEQMWPSLCKGSWRGGSSIGVCLNVFQRTLVDGGITTSIRGEVCYADWVP